MADVWLLLSIYNCVKVTVMRIREIKAKSVLSKSQVYDYALNPYVGCTHACVYCYARFMKRFTGHREMWGEFLDVKINAPELLMKEIGRKKPGRVWVSGVCDPYQTAEKRYGLTKRCLEILIENGWAVTVQTKSPLVLRDLEILKRSQDSEVCLTVTTADENIRRIFEPGAPSIAMIAPVLPGAEGLVEMLKGCVDHVLVDRLNYHYADRIYKKHKMEWAMEDGFFRRMGETLRKGFEKEGIPCQMLFKYLYNLFHFFHERT
ncbi:MAG: Radical SAM domain protein [Deltaproteobacteria bacterium]|nr:Radical SAM domain protein [Deltaproteobacteria bacterium]